MRFICTELSENTNDLYLTSTIEQAELLDSGRVYKKVFTKEVKGQGKITSYLCDTAIPIIYSSWNLPTAYKTIAEYATLRGFTITDNTGLTTTNFYWNNHSMMTAKCSWFYTIITETAVVVSKPYRASTSKQFTGEVISALTNAQTSFDFEGDTGSDFTIDYNADSVLPSIIATSEKSAAINKYKSKQSIIYVQSGQDINALDYYLYNGSFYVAVNRQEVAPWQFLYACVKEEKTTYTFTGSDITPQLALPAASPTRYYAIFRDEKASGTVGGSFTAGADRTRTLVESYNNISGASISSNQVVLPTGTYKITGWTTAYRVNRVHNWLYNISDSAVEIDGGSGFSASGGSYSDTRIYFNGVITIAASKTFELRERCESNSADTNGLGVPASFGVEVYAELVCEKIA